MAKVQMSCPRCRQPLIADVEQLFDVDADPSAKQRLLSGQSNMAACQSCGYQGPVSVPVVYHDSSKQLLLTYFPADLGLPVNEQERLVGPYITTVMNRLPAEKRGAYLLQPKNMLTFQTMIETVLEKDGITKDMIEASQKRLNLLQRLLTISTPESRAEVISQEGALMDRDFFQMLGRLIEASMASGDQQSARALATIQQEIIPQTEFGRQMQEQMNTVQAAVRELQEAGEKGLTREILLDVIIKYADNENVVANLTSLTRQGMDYEFFGLLTERINAASGADAEKLTELRKKLLEFTKELDLQMEAHLNQTRDLLEELIKTPDLEQVLGEVLPHLDEAFAQVMQSELQAARQKGDLQRSAKIQQIAEAIQKASTPPGAELIESLLSTQDPEEQRKLLNEHAEEITPDFLQMLNSLAAQMEEENQPEFQQQVQEIYRMALRISMQANLKK
ncbi:MAG: hypothetical protein JW987_11370 [Anaerolineaceae bacterium]|nr:hypothetical protein [Anaerolineaceae bacterium]